VHISLRVQPELLKAIDQAAEREASSRGKWIKDTLRRALVASGTVTPAESEMGALQELIEAEFAGLQESFSSLKEVRQLTESVVKLSIETVMIGRQLALQTPGVLEKAQINAREYYSNVTRRVPSANGNNSSGSDAS
jgi:hypothetical protein